MKRGFTVCELLIGLGVLGVIAAMLFPVIARSRENAERDHTSCPGHMRLVGRSVALYRADHDDRFPIARDPAATRGWADALASYGLEARDLQCHAATDDQSGLDANAARHTDYFYNARLQGLAGADLKEASVTILSGDGENEMTVASPHYALKTLPRDWLWNESSPTRRHMKNYFLGFADGHAKYLDVRRLRDLDHPERSQYGFVPSNQTNRKTP